MSKVILQGYIKVAEDDLDAVMQALPKHIELTRQEPGCLTFRVTQKKDQPTEFDVYEEFVDQAAFDQHQVRTKASAWAKVTKNVERFYSID